MGRCRVSAPEGRTLLPGAGSNPRFNPSIFTRICPFNRERAYRSQKQLGNLTEAASWHSRHAARLTRLSPASPSPAILALG